MDFYLYIKYILCCHPPGKRATIGCMVDIGLKKRRKNNVSAWTKYFPQRKKNVPPASRGDAKWCNVACILP